MEQWSNGPMDQWSNGQLLIQLGEKRKEYQNNSEFRQKRLLLSDRKGWAESDTEKVVGQLEIRHNHNKSRS